MKHIFDPQNKLTTANKLQLIEQWSQRQQGSAAGALDVATAHTQKRAIYDRINSSAYKDKSGNVDPARLEANMKIAEGFKNAVNEVHPDMIPINAQMHNAITLQDALKQAAKESPKEFNILTNLLIGGVTGSTVAMRGGGMAESAGAGMAGILALQALKSPRIATQLSILMGKRFPQVAAALDPLRAVAQPAALAARPLGNHLIQSPTQAAPQ